MPTEHDPFAPHHVGGPYADDPDGFPARRLARAGLPEDAVGHLRDWYEQASPEQQAEWRGTIHSAPDSAIRGRFVPPGGDLEHLTKEQLGELLRAAGQPVTGNKPDLIARLTAETPSEPPGGDGTPAPPDDTDPGAAGGDGQPETAGDPLAPNPEAALAGEQPPNEQPTTAEPQTGAQQPPDPAEEGTPQGQPGAPQELSHEPPVTAPADDAQQPAHEPRRSTPRRSGGTGPGART